MVKVGVLGGTFDPIHIAHLVIAEESRARLHLDQVFFIPAGQPPHKPTRHITAAEQRIAMVLQAIASNPYFVFSRLDIDRAGPCYSVDTLELLQNQLGPEVEIYFILGLDSLAEIPTWHDPARFITLCRLAVIGRPGCTADMEHLESVLPGIASRVTMVEAPEMSISSTDIQRRVRLGLPIKYQVPESVEAYIYEHALYHSD